jgi:hypothetical protein
VCGLEVRDDGLDVFGGLMKFFSQLIEGLFSHVFATIHSKPQPYRLSTPLVSSGDVFKRLTPTQSVKHHFLFVVRPRLTPLAHFSSLPISMTRSFSSSIEKIDKKLIQTVRGYELIKYLMATRWKRVFNVLNSLSIDIKRVENCRWFDIFLLFICSSNKK